MPNSEAHNAVTLKCGVKENVGPVNSMIDLESAGEAPSHSSLVRIYKAYTSTGV